MPYKMTYPSHHMCDSIPLSFSSTLGVTTQPQEGTTPENFVNPSAASRTEHVTLSATLSPQHHFACAACSSFPACSATAAQQCAALPTAACSSPEYTTTSTAEPGVDWSPNGTHDKSSNSDAVCCILLEQRRHVKPSCKVALLLHLGTAFAGASLILSSFLSTYYLFFIHLSLPIVALHVSKVVFGFLLIVSEIPELNQSSLFSELHFWVSTWFRFLTHAVYKAFFCVFLGSLCAALNAPQMYTTALALYLVVLGMLHALFCAKRLFTLRQPDETALGPMVNVFSTELERKSLESTLRYDLENPHVERLLSTYAPLSVSAAP